MSAPDVDDARSLSGDGPWTLEAETVIEPVGPGRWNCRLSDRWNIGDNPNGGYGAAIVTRAMQRLGGHPDPISVTAHFLRPALGGQPGAVTAELVRSGRTTATVRGALSQDGKERIAMLASFGELADPVSVTGPELAIEPPDLPPPDECLDRSGLDQRVTLPITSRLDVRIHPAHAVAGASDRAEIAGWIRLLDGRPPDPSVLPLFADAFPPSLYSFVAEIGWVPTIELTVHVRRRPAPGWIRARFTCADLHDGRMIEDGALWDNTGALVARSRQIGLLLD